jgi:hypothetical protein
MKISYSDSMDPRALVCKCICRVKVVPLQAMEELGGGGEEV